MVRKQVYIEPEQDELLKQRSAQLGVTESELIRQGIDHVTKPRRLPEDEALWQDALAFMRERGRLEVPQGRRTWTRDELYEERLDELARRRAR
ncbi:MAG: ribbon-helix-helix domain-containing protein [Thermoleophilia bacterium]|nr:ribbon-helix-helix domain-containing protein [Thermoleophilia bacterium]